MMNTTPKIEATSRCSACGAAMVCGRDDPAGCWCARLPPLAASAVVPAADCVCEPCLRSRAVSTEREVSRSRL